MKICLDAGHYGKYNQSPRNKNYYESVQMWKLTNYQKQFLEEYEGVTVKLTRGDMNKDLSLYDRGYTAQGYDLFLSNHSNAADGESTDYPVVIGAYDLKENILGQKFANCIAKTMKTRQAGRVWTRKGSNGEYYGVLRGARAANVAGKRYYIIEHSFHTNTNAANWLMEDMNLRALAKAEVQVIAEYFKLKKKTNNTGTNKNTYVVNTDVLNVRSGRGTEFSVVGQLKRGQEITIWAIAKDKAGNDWGSFRYSFDPDVIGFVSMKYLK